MSSTLETLRRETEAQFSELAAQQELPDFADIDYFFAPTQTAQSFDRLAEKLTALDFEVSHTEDGLGLIATLPDQMISADGLWIGEAMAAREALALGWEPKGWGF